MKYKRTMIITYGAFNSPIDTADWTGDIDTGSLDKAKSVVTVNTLIPDKFKSDIDALCSLGRVKELKAGMNLRISLEEIFQVVPRQRKRIDSYDSLIAFLRDEMLVNLNIISNKTKNYGN